MLFTYFSDTNEIKDLLTLILTSGDPNPETTIIDEGLTFLFAGTPLLLKTNIHYSLGYDTTSKLLVYTSYNYINFYTAMVILLFVHVS